MRTTTILAAIVAAMTLSGCITVQQERAALYQTGTLNVHCTKTEATTRYGTKDFTYTSSLAIGESQPIASVTRIIGSDSQTAQLYKDQPLRVHFGRISLDGRGPESSVAFDLRLVDGKLVADPVVEPEPAKK